MSPTSRGRKSKSSGGRGKRTVRSVDASRPPRSAVAGLSDMLGPRERPSWFDGSIRAVLDGSQDLISVDGPRELEQHTSELIGAELHRAVHEEHEGLWFGWWLAELIDAAETRVEQHADDGPWEGPFRLLHGLAAMVPSSRLPRPVLNRARKRLRRVADRIPAWLADTSRITATGEVTLLRDAYGTRFAVIAEYAQRSADRSVFLFDIDVSGFTGLTDAGVFDDAGRAADAWRAAVGEAAEYARAEPVRDVGELVVLVHLDTGEEGVLKGNEPRPVLDNWFRARRRIDDLAHALRRRGTPLPPAGSLYHDLDLSVLADPFTEWYRTRHGVKPGPEAVGALADEWMRGVLPQTWFCVSPQRVEFVGALVGDWIEDDITAEVKRLLPDWVRWLSERAALPEHLHTARGRRSAGCRRQTRDGRGHLRGERVTLPPHVRPASAGGRRPPALCPRWPGRSPSSPAAGTP